MDLLAVLDKELVGLDTEQTGLDTEQTGSGMEQAGQDKVQIDQAMAQAGLDKELTGYWGKVHYQLVVLDKEVVVMSGMERYLLQQLDMVAAVGMIVSQVDLA